MPRTSNRRWKGCPMCKGHKYAQQGDVIRIPHAALLQMGVGIPHRVSRHDVPAVEHEPEREPDCRHGCNGDCVVTGSNVCDFTCHDNETVTAAVEAWGSRLVAT